MSRKSLEEIKAKLNLIDNDTLNTEVKLAKVRMLIDHLRCEFRKKSNAGEPVCGWANGTVQFIYKQYIQKKPHKWG